MTRGFIDALQSAQPNALVDAGAATPVIAPDSVDALCQVLRLATEHTTKLALAPLPAPPTGCTLSLAKLNAVRGIDTDSRIIHVETGAEIADVEAVAAEHGWTLGATDGHGSASRAHSVLDWIASPGFRASKDNDPVSQRIAGAEMVLATGERMPIRPAPRRAVGPDLLPAFIDAHGRLGIVASVHLVAHQAASLLRLRFDFPSADAAKAALAWIRGRGARPHYAEVSGSRLSLAFGKDGPRAEAVERVVRDVVGARGGRPAPSGAEEAGAETAKPWPLSRAVVKLAQQLDPAGVLQP